MKSDSEEQEKTELWLGNLNLGLGGVKERVIMRSDGVSSPSYF